MRGTANRAAAASLDGHEAREERGAGRTLVAEYPKSDYGREGADVLKELGK